MKEKYLQTEKVKIVKELKIVDKLGTWVQIEYLTGDNIGSRKPIPIEELEEK
jgi:hypothetical protein